MIHEDWRKLANAIKALPEGQRLFSTRYFHGCTTDTRKVCGCALGQIAFHLTGAYEKAPFLGIRLEIKELSACNLYSINDGFRPFDDSDEACVARYAHVLAECERMATPPEVESC